MDAAVRISQFSIILNSRYVRASEEEHTEQIQMWHFWIILFRYSPSTTCFRTEIFFVHKNVDHCSPNSAFSRRESVRTLEQRVPKCCVRRGRSKCEIPKFANSALMVCARCVSFCLIRRVRTLPCCTREREWAGRSSRLEARRGYVGGFSVKLTQCKTAR